MEKKSIGQFIAALRKANGMTQKQLAEKLNVSDKAVSRWERDESAPDLTLIPIIADIFQVTADEILRGQRLNLQDSQTHKSNAKTEKQIQHLLKQTNTKFSIRSLICIAIGILGFFVAAICNFGINRAYIGFMLACILYIVAIILEAIFTKLTFFAINDEEFECNKLNTYKKSFVNTAIRTYCAIVFLFAITLPLAILPWDTYMGVIFDDWLVNGIIYGIIALIICAIAAWTAKHLSVKKGIYSLSEQEEEKYKNLNRLRIKYLIILSAIIIATYIMHSIYDSFDPVNNFIDGQTFTDIESFIEYMETPTDDYDEDFFISYNHDDTAITYYDSDGNEFSMEEALTECYDYIYSADGKSTIAKYAHRNYDVCQIEYEYDNNDIKSITVYTQNDMTTYSTISNTISAIWLALYVLEIVVIGIIYNNKRKKL